MDGELFAANGSARDYELCGSLAQLAAEGFVEALLFTRFSLESRFSHSESSRFATRSRIVSMRVELTPNKLLCGSFCRSAWQKFRPRKMFLRIPSLFP